MGNKSTLDWLKNLSNVLNSVIEQTNEQQVSIVFSKNMAIQMKNDIDYIEQVLTTKSKMEVDKTYQIKQVVEAQSSLKRLKQETCPATYMDDFDKDKEIEVLKQAVLRLDQLERKLDRWAELLKCDGVNSKTMVANDIQFMRETRA